MNPTLRQYHKATEAATRHVSANVSKAVRVDLPHTRLSLFDPVTEPPVLAQTENRLTGHSTQSRFHEDRPNNLGPRAPSISEWLRGGLSDGLLSQCRHKVSDRDAGTFR